METGVVAMVAGATAAALVGFGFYRRGRRARARRVGEGVTGFLTARYGGPPPGLHIDCSDDDLWPVLVRFDHPQTGARHCLRFDCHGPRSALSLLSEEVR
jgi:hypothetical protein